MGRQPRLVADGLVYHALNRGNNRAPVFFDAADFQAFLLALRQTRERYPFRLFAYCLMKNHFHLVLQPEKGANVSRVLQSVTVAHTWHYHKERASSGHVWQGRFKSPVIEEDEHLLTVMRYVEANPLRAGITEDLASYPWSSYPVHGLGKSDDLVAEAPVWRGLGTTEGARQKRWRKWVHRPLTDKELNGVRGAVTTGRPFGTESWVDEMATRLGLDLGPRRRGRPPKRTDK
jgi:putative transposase